MNSSVDKRRLTSSELSEYQRLTDRRGIPGDNLWALSVGFGLLLVWAGLGFAVIYPLVTSDEAQQVSGEAWTLLALVVVLGGMAAWVWAVVRLWKRRVMARAMDYLLSIGYQSRELPPDPVSDGDSDAGSPYWMTGSYDPERYYGYSKPERDYMRLTGIDADTYDSNVRDRD